MKLMALLVPCAFISSVSFAASVQRAGTIQIGYDRDANLPITKEISVGYSTSAEDATLDIEGEGRISATREKSQISGYVSSPKKYFYYTLELNPKTGKFGDGKDLVIVEDRGAGMTGCREGANALLTGFKGDGTKQNFCVTIK